MSDPARYEIRIVPSAERDMKSIPSDVLRRINDTILGLESVPRPKTCKRLRGREGYRMRVGSYRILYLIDDMARTVQVVAVGHRKDVYR